MGAALLCAEADIACTTLENQAAYVASWLKVLEEDSRAVVIAAAQAQRAVDRILGGAKFDRQRSRLRVGSDGPVPTD